MSDDDAIPEDVMEAAMQAVREQQLILAAIYGTGFMNQGMVDPIVRAISAEREKQIAERERQRRSLVAQAAPDLYAVFVAQKDMHE